MTKPLTGKTNDFLRIVLPACASGNLVAVKQYLADERGFVHWIGPHGRTMIWEAARKGRLSVVKLLAEEHEGDLTAIGCYYRETRVEVSPWMVATINNHSAVADYLDESGAGLDFRSACFLGKIDFVMAVLADDSEAANQPYIREHEWNGYVVWPLQYAIAGSQPEVVTCLLDAGADPQASRGILFDAIDTGQLDIAELLLAAGANPLEARHRDWLEAPRFNKLARKYGHRIQEVDVPPEKWPRIVDESRGNHNAPDDPRRVKRLIEKGHDVNVRDYKGKTALHRASQAGFEKITQLLIEHGADLEARSETGETPLFDAAFYGKPAIIEILIAAGANIEACNDVEETPVFAAVRGGRVNAVRMLERLNASFQAVNSKGYSASDIALRSNKKGINEVRAALAEVVGDETQTANRHPKVRRHK